MDLEDEDATKVESSGAGAARALIAGVNDVVAVGVSDCDVVVAGENGLVPSKATAAGDADVALVSEVTSIVADCDMVAGGERGLDPRKAVAAGDGGVALVSDVTAVVADDDVAAAGRGDVDFVSEVAVVAPGGASGPKEGDVPVVSEVAVIAGGQAAEAGERDVAFVGDLKVVNVGRAAAKRRRVAAPSDPCSATTNGDSDVAGLIVGGTTPAAKGAMVIDSGSESSSSSSSSDDRSRSRGRRVRTAQERLGAAAGAAILTAAAPLDVDECDAIVERELSMPTDLAMELQHEGGLVAIMAETSTVIAAWPLPDTGRSVLRISGNGGGVGRAAWQLEQLREEHRSRQEAAAQVAEERDANERLEQLEIPPERMSAVVGPNGAHLAQIREKCGGIMIALQPSADPRGPLTAFIGPGRRASVLLAKRELQRRLDGACDLAEKNAEAEKLVEAQKPAAVEKPAVVEKHVEAEEFVEVQRSIEIEQASNGKLLEARGPLTAHCPSSGEA